MEFRDIRRGFTAGLAGLLIAGTLNVLPAQAKNKWEDCRTEQTEVGSSEFDSIMKKYEKDLVKKIRKEFTLDNYGHILCEYGGEIRANTPNKMEMKDPKINCIFFDYIDLDGVPIEWEATMRAEVKYLNGVVGKFNVGLYFEEGTFSVEIDEVD
jgi:hypothetical protein